MAATTTMPIENTCTQLTLFRADVDKFMSAPMNAWSKTLKGCAICGTTTANVYVLICGHGAHHACNVCAKSNAKITKTETARTGTKVCCGAAGCKAAAVLLPAPTFTAGMIQGKNMLEYELHERKSALLRAADTSGADLRRELVGKKRGIKQIEDPEERAAAQAENAAKRLKYKERKAAEAEEKRIAKENALILRYLSEVHGQPYVDELLGKAEEHNEAAQLADDDDAAECHECLIEEEEE